MYAYSCDGSQNSGYNCRRQGNEDSVLYGKHKRTCSLHISCEQVGIQLGGKAGPVAQNLAFRERKYRYEDYRRIEDHQQQPDITLCKESFHNYTVPPLTSFMLSCSRLVIPMMTSIISDSAAP